MVMFGLRGLAEKCSAGNNDYKDNSRAALLENIVPVLAFCVETHTNNEDLILASAKVLKGISDYLVVNPNKDYITKIQDEKGVDTGFLILKSATSRTDDECLLICSDYFTNLQQLNVPMSFSGFLPQLLENISPEKPIQFNVSLFKLGKIALEKEKLGDDEATSVVTKVLHFLDKVNLTSKNANEAVLRALTIVELYKDQKSKISRFASCLLRILDIFKSDKAIYNKACSILTSVVDIEEVQRSLKLLASESENTDEKEKALASLMAVSYVPSYADVIASSGAIQLLSAAIMKSLDSLETTKSNPKIMEGVVGACKVLGKISENASNVESIIQGGGLVILLKALRFCKDDPSNAAILCEALVRIVKTPSNVAQFDELGGIEQIIELVTNTLNDSSLVTIGVELLSRGFTLETVSPKLYEPSTIGCFSKVLKNNKDNVQIQKNLFTGFSHLVKHLDSFTTISEIYQILVSNIKIENNLNADHSVSALQFINNVIQKFDLPQDYREETINAVLNIFLIFSDYVDVQFLGKSILRRIVTEENIEKSLEQVTQSLNDPKARLDISFRALATINGLSHVPQLEHAFEKFELQSTILAALRRWVETPSFPNQQRLIKAATKSLESLQQKVNTSSFSVLMRLCDIALLPQMRMLSEKQTIGDTSLLDVLMCCLALCSSPLLFKDGSIDKNDMFQFIEILSKISWTYQDLRIVQLFWINVLTEIVRNNEVVQLLCDAGTIKNVLHYMSKVIIYEDIQTAGLQFLLTCIENYRPSLEVIKASGGVQAVKGINSHHRSSTIRPLLTKLSSLLLPTGVTDGEIRSTMDQIAEAIQKQDLERATNHIEALGTMVSSAEAIRLVTNNRFRCILNVDLKKFPGVSDKEKVRFAIHVSILMKSLCESRHGINYLHRITPDQFLTSLMNQMTETTSERTDKEQQGIEANLQVSRHLDKLRSLDSSCDTSINLKRRIAQFCLIVQTYPQDKRILEAASAAISVIQTKSPDDVQQLNEFCHILQCNIKAPDLKERICAVSSISNLCGRLNSKAFSHIKNESIDSLFDAIEAHGDNPEELICLTKALYDISKRCNLRDYLAGHEDKGRLEKYLNMSCRYFLESYKTKPECALHLARLLTCLVDKTDNKLLKEIGVLDAIYECSVLHSNNPEMFDAVGGLLRKVDPSRTLSSIIQEIITLSSEKSVNQVALEISCRNFATLVASQKTDIADEVPNILKMCDCLKSLLERENIDASLLGSISVASRYLAGYLEDHDRCGRITAQKCNLHLSTTLAPIFADFFSTGSHQATTNKEFLVNGSIALGGIASDRRAYSTMVDLAKKSNLIAATKKLLKDHENDPDIVSAILFLLSRIAQDGDGYNAILNQLNSGATSRNIGLQLIEDTVMNIRKHEGSRIVVKSAIPLAGMAFIHSPELLSNKGLVDNFHKIASTSPEGVTALLDFYTKLSEGKYKDNLDEELQNMSKTFLQMYNDINITPEQRNVLTTAYTKMIKSLIEEDNIGLLNKLDALGSLNNLLEENSQQTDVAKIILDTLNALAGLDSNYCKQVARNCPLVSTEFINMLLKKDPTLAKNIVEFLTTLACEEGNGAILTKRVNLHELQSILKDHGLNCPELNAEEFTNSVNNLLCLIEDDNPEQQSLKQLYMKWKEQEKNQQLLDATESALVTNNLFFLFDTTMELASKPISDIQSPQGQEFMYGCLCFSLLTSFEQNIPICMDKNEDEVLLRAFGVQKNTEVVQCAVIACRDLCAFSDAAEQFNLLPKSKAILVELLSLALQEKNQATVESADGLIIPRLQLITSCASVSTYFNDTQLMPILMAIWTKCDKGIYGEDTKGHTFRAMRRIVNSHWKDCLLENNVTRRLVAEINESVIRVTLLVDVLYVVGALATIQDFKSLLAEHGSIEACLNLITRCFEDQKQNTDPVQINACLALANITIADRKNIEKFIAGGGIEISVKVMTMTVEDSPKYDLANASAVLMCNVSYRRDDVKKLYGDKLGPKAITQAIRKYDGSASISALRCLSSMLKAIGNMALYIPNVKTFMEESVVQTFSHLYRNSVFVPDDLLLVSLRTMSNLVMENEQQYMKEFGEVMLPILEMLTKTQHENAQMLCLAFDVLANLCRLESNYQVFVKNKGLETVLCIANTHTDPQLCISTIHLCTSQLSEKKNLDTLLKAGFMKFLVNNLELQCSSEDRQADLSAYLLQGVSCILVNQHVARQYQHMLGVAVLVKFAHSSSDSALLLLQVYRTLVILLSLFHEQSVTRNEIKPTEHDDWDAHVPDEGVNLIVSDTSSDLHAWQKLGLETTTIRDLIGSICYALSIPEYARHLKLQTFGIGLLAYFAWEQIPSMTSVFYAGSYQNVLRNALLSFSGDPVVSELACITLIHVSYASEKDDYLTVARNSQLIEAFEQSSSKNFLRLIKVKDMCSVVAKLLADQKNIDPGKFKHLIYDTFDFQLINSKNSLYPHGVQGLPPDVKSILREGLRAKLIQEGKTRVPFYWRASQDLTLLQWHTNNDKNSVYDNEVQITSLKSVARGLTNPVLQAAAAKDRKVNANVCVCLSGFVSKAFPQGLELNLKHKSKKERDQMVHLICEWRDAATQCF